MRRFIYLDTDTLNSYLAQIFDGLIQSQEMEKARAKRRKSKTILAVISEVKLHSSFLEKV